MVQRRTRSTRFDEWLDQDPIPPTDSVDVEHDSLESWSRARVRTWKHWQTLISKPHIPVGEDFRLNPPARDERRAWPPKGAKWDGIPPGR
jgi:hypothetical protein